MFNWFICIIDYFHSDIFFLKYEEQVAKIVIFYVHMVIDYYPLAIYLIHMIKEKSFKHAENIWILLDSNFLPSNEVFNLF